MNIPFLRTYLQNVLTTMPAGWLETTTHRLDIYNEQKAKSQFLAQFEDLYNSQTATTEALDALPTAYDYIRLGHPLSSVLEWAIAATHKLDAGNVISFDSLTMPILAILRTNLLSGKKTQINFTGALPAVLDRALLKSIYGYNFELNEVSNASEIKAFNGSVVYVYHEDAVGNLEPNPSIDFYISLHGDLGSILVINGTQNDAYVAAIQHVRRRETIAMTPSNCELALKSFISQTTYNTIATNLVAHKNSVQDAIKEITGTAATPLVASSGLSMQYAIMMGLIHDAQTNHAGKAIKFIVPPNCYGGTNDQARRVAACLENVSIVDLPVDGDNDMNQSIDTVLNELALEDAIPYIIAEIPTNPRVEVPDLVRLKEVLTKKRRTKNDTVAIDPVFILDQTFCPNVHFLGEEKILATVRTLAYASGSKFPSGGRCTAGYCVGNSLANSLMEHVALHLDICDNEATALQYEILAEQLPSMNARIDAAYHNTRDFVNYIHDVLPDAKINFVSEELALQGFTPSVFSLDLPTKGNTAQERENYKRELNLKLIHLMITKIPAESKFCVSYGQLKGCYWTIPATSTQGTTKEGDKDYIVRASLSGAMDMHMHKAVFKEFVKTNYLE